MNKYIHIFFLAPISNIRMRLFPTYKSFKLVNLVSSAGNFPVKEFDDRILKKDVSNIVTSQEIWVAYDNLFYMKVERNYSFCKLISFLISGGMLPVNKFPSILL